MKQTIEADDPDWPGRWRRVLGQTRTLADNAQVQALLAELSAPSKPDVLAFVNAHAMNTVAEADLFYQDLLDADLILRDGAGMAALYRLEARAPGLNMNGTDLIPRIIPCFNGRKIALLGTREPYLADAARAIKERLAPDSELVTANGFLDEAQYLALVVQHRPELIVLGMGMPRQERVAKALKTAAVAPCLIICGGAVIDFLGNRMRRAPRLLRRMGLEWLYRLAREPRRLFARYVIGNPQFLVRALRFATLRHQ